MKIQKLNRIITVLIILCIIVLVILIGNIIKELTNEIKETATLDTIENYHYILKDNDTEYYKKTFKELKEILKQEEINEEEYAKTISKLFIIDFYSLATSINKNDVGGVQYIKEDYQETFVKMAKDSIYSNVENNIYGDRNQILPNVTNVEIMEITEEQDGYQVMVDITYDQDLGYATSVALTLVRRDNLLEISSLKEM